MSLKDTQNSIWGHTFYSLKDKAYQYALNQRFKAYDRIDALRAQVDTADKLKTYYTKAKATLKAVIGDLPYHSDYPLNMQVFSTVEEENLLIKNIVFNSRENVYVTANLYLPKDRAEKSPAVLLQCGHSKNGKASVAYQRAARVIASAGIIVLVTDPPGQGERVQYITESGEPVISPAVPNHQQFGNQCFLAGNSPVKYFLADAIKSIDLLCSLEEVDSDKIGATGISGGGTMTSLLMAYDDRIKAAAPGCWPCSGREYFVVGTAPDSEQIWPGILSNNIDVFEIMACMCPKPLLLLAAEYDFIPFEGVTKLYNETKRLYTLADSLDNVKICAVKEPHGYSLGLAQAAAEFFAKHLCNKEYKSPETDVKTLDDQDLYCTKSGKVLLNYKNNVIIFEENLDKYNKNLKNPPSESEIFQFFDERVFNGRRKDNDIYLRKLQCANDDNFHLQPYLCFTHEMMPCYGILIKSTCHQDKDLPVTICLWQGGTNSISEMEEKIKEICSGGRSAFVVDLTAMGKCAPFNMRGDTDVNAAISSMTDKIAKSLFMSDDSLCALKAYDLMQTIRVLREEISKDIELYTTGKYCVFGRIAEILDQDIKLQVENEVKVSDLIKNKYYDTYDTPQIIMPGIGKYLN